MEILITIVFLIIVIIAIIKLFTEITEKIDDSFSKSERTIIPKKSNTQDLQDLKMQEQKAKADQEKLKAEALKIQIEQEKLNIITQKQKQIKFEQKEANRIKRQEKKKNQDNRPLTKVFAISEEQKYQEFQPLEEKINTLKAEIRSLENNIHALRKTNHEKNADISSLQNQNAEKEKKIHSLQQENEKLLSTIETIRKELEETEKENREYLNAMAEIEHPTDYRQKYRKPYRCTDGDYVRSKAEREIDNFLYYHRIWHIYEQKYQVTSDTSYYPDFFLPDYNLYIEYFGINDLKKYQEKTNTKKQIYSRDKTNHFEFLTAEDDENIDDQLIKICKKYNIPTT